MPILFCVVRLTESDTSFAKIVVGVAWIAPNLFGLAFWEFEPHVLVRSCWVNGKPPSSLQINGLQTTNQWEADWSALGQALTVLNTSRARRKAEGSFKCGPYLERAGGVQALEGLDLMRRKLDTTNFERLGVLDLSPLIVQRGGSADQASAEEDY